MNKTLRFARVTTIAAAASIAVALLSTPTPPETPEDVVSALSAAGLEYEGKWLGEESGFHHGFHVKPKGDTRTWEELANVDDLPSSTHHVIFTPIKGNVESHPIIGRYYLVGDPDEIQRILDALR